MQTPQSIPMLRPVYLASLSVLQIVLIAELAPPLALAFRTDALAGLAPSGWGALLQLSAMGLAIAGSAVALVFPGMALARHRRAGAMRFFGLPRWAVGLTLAGALVVAAATVALAFAPGLADDARVTVLLIARPALRGGLALAAAGALCSELLRRGVAARGPKHAPRHSTGRIEVTYPPEHRTYALPSTVPHIQGRSG